jgi:hypothetical protein
MRAATTVCLFWALAGSFVALAAIPVIEGSIDESAAPWDGPAYALILRLGQGSSVLRVDLWGHPHSDGPLSLRFTGYENPGGGRGRGDGRVSFQEILNKSTPVPLSGRLVFDRLEEGKPVTGHYELNSIDQSRGFKGVFQAKWGSSGGSGHQALVP